MVSHKISKSMMCIGFFVCVFLFYWFPESEHKHV